MVVAGGNAADQPITRSPDALRERTTHAETPAVPITTTTENAATDTLSAASGTTPDAHETESTQPADLDTRSCEACTTIPPAGADESFPPSLVGFVPLIPNLKKSEDLRGTGDQAVSDVVDAAKRESQCPAPKIVPINARLAVCFSCWRRDFRDRLTAVHEAGDTARCDSTELEPFHGGGSTRCRRCGSAGSHAVMAAPHQIGRWVW